MSFKDIVKRISVEKYDKLTVFENSKDTNTTLNGVEKHLDLANNGTEKNYTNFETVSEKDIILLAKEEDIFIIYPKHYYHYLLFQKYQNIEDKYFRAIEVLVNNTKSKVWSFYQINSITKNEIFFDENGWHFKPKIADMIFARIYN
jgi:hypothetical protein|tara:strand:- start:58 stop:495 length:438 start_codon:yes stop_codon:yes gene_type:complete